MKKGIGEKKMSEKFTDAHLKRDKLAHKHHEDMGTEAKETKLPGQMYVPKKVHNESDFAGEDR
jgi:hypothetical protein